MNNTISSEQTHAVAETYHNWLTGLALSIISKIGAHTAEEFIFRLFRVQPIHLILEDDFLEIEEAFFRAHLQVGN